LLPTLVRWAHLTAAALLLGGAVVALASLRGARSKAPSGDVSPPLEAVYRFEWIAWAAIGLVVMTGIGNLGAFGIHLQPPESRWGTLLFAKLLLVLLFLPLSLVRSLLVAKLRAAPEAPRAPLVALFAASFVVLLAIALLAVFLAHG
jgi:uncharacterized membrane protein